MQSTSIEIPSLGRPVANTDWINYGFITEFLAFMVKPENRGIHANMQNIGKAAIRLFNGFEMPGEGEIESRQLLGNIVAKSLTVKTTAPHLYENKRGLDLLLMLEFDPALRREFAAVRREVRHTTDTYRPPAPPIAYGIHLVRFTPESVKPDHRPQLIDLVEKVRPPYVILGEAQPLT